MDVSSIASVATAMQAQRVGDAVAITVLRKALDIEAAGALALLQAMPQVTPAADLTSSLGQNLNVYA